MSDKVLTNGFEKADSYETLIGMALDLHWSWNHATDDLWRLLEPELWALTHNPWVVLQSVSPARLQSAMEDESVKQLLQRLQEKQDALNAPAWFQKTYPDSKLKTAAYFSMEYMLSEALPIYSGGLGNVAGDQLKAASDLGVPLVGVGLLYQQGYFRQEIDAEGKQRALYPYNDPGQLPIAPVRNADGEWLRLQIELPGSSLWIRAWQVQIGRCRLYLLDTNDPANLPAYRGIASELYGGDSELRLKQEIVLGIAGWRLLRALGIDPEVCHLNEGHAAFAILERARMWMVDHQQPFHIALAATRAGNLFTTHTPVEAGFDRFAPELLATYMQHYAEQYLGISFADLLALGRENPSNSAELFNMAYLAVHGSGRVNGVSRLHGQVSRKIFQPLFPRWPQPEVPVSHVTNGIHTPTWISVESDVIWTEVCGKDHWLDEPGNIENTFQKVSDDALWQMRGAARKTLVEHVRKILPRQMAGQGATEAKVAQARTILDPDVLTIGFARRFAPYKRPNLLLYDQERLIRILSNSSTPVQLVIAGKAHPKDTYGQALVEQWIRFMRLPEVRPHAVFLADYDMLMAARLVRGVDVWLNTPRRPWEASGTSGMKVLANGGINLSELDGWWVEAFTQEVGWALGDGNEHGDDPAWDIAEANTLYSLLEEEVIPAFYHRDDKGIPGAWTARMRQSMARLTPTYSANRAVREYTEKHYLPAAADYMTRTANSGEQAKVLTAWQDDLLKRWPGVQFGELTVTEDGDHLHFTVAVDLNGIDPKTVSVELYANPVVDTKIFRQKMQMQEGSSLYIAQAPADRPASDYTPRVIPSQAEIAIPLELDAICWQR